MIKGSLILKTKEIENFDSLCKQKLIMRENKYKEVEATTEDIKYHLIDEILEAFFIKNKVKGNIVRDILLESKIDKPELLDVANLSKAVYISMEDDEKKNEY